MQELTPNVTRLESADAVSNIYGITRLMRMALPENDYSYREFHSQIGSLVNPQLKKTALFVARSMYGFLDNPATDSEISGFASTRRAYDEGASGLHIEHIFVDPNQRRRGLGHQLVVACVEYARDQDDAFVQIDNDYDTAESQHLLSSLGFKQNGDAPPVLILR
jgi:ribosomal protein S18 acetylase RimI-like enzyme